jgi:hypothetical protein
MPAGVASASTPVIARNAPYRHREKRATLCHCKGRASPRAPRTEPYVRLSRIRLPSWVSDGKALVRPRMGDARLREPSIREGDDPFPRGPVLLSAPRQRAQPVADHVRSERPQSSRVGRHRVIGEESALHLAQPAALFADRRMQPSPQPSRTAANRARIRSRRVFRLS